MIYVRNDFFLLLAQIGFVLTIVKGDPSTSINTVLPKNIPVQSQNTIDCNKLPAGHYTCKTNDNCTYGTFTFFPCSVNEGIECNGNRSVELEFQCRYCYLTVPNEEHVCTQDNTSCRVISTPRSRVKGVCATKDHVFCLGNRTFSKMMWCNWTSGYSWPVAFVLSITVGGFGIDRFYLGHWREGLGKLFSFGGLGVWTLIDVVLIGTGYVGPADSSLFVY